MKEMGVDGMKETTSVAMCSDAVSRDTALDHIEREQMENFLVPC